MSLFDDWKRAKPLIESGLHMMQGAYTIDDVTILLGAGHFKLWSLENSALLTEFVTYPQFKVLNLWSAGGKLDELLALRPRLIECAKQNGCKGGTALGRMGWERVFPEAKRLGPMLYWEV